MYNLEYYVKVNTPSNRLKWVWLLGNKKNVLLPDGLLFFLKIIQAGVVAKNKMNFDVRPNVVLGET